MTTILTFFFKKFSTASVTINADRYSATFKLRAPQRDPFKVMAPQRDPFKLQGQERDPV